MGPVRASWRKGTGPEILKKEQGKTLILPNQMREEDHKALGIGYQVDEDKLYMFKFSQLLQKEEKNESWQRSSQRGCENGDT